MPCNHNTLFFSPSAHATVVGFRRAASSQRLAAALPPGKASNASDIEVPAPTFPGPLVLPGDDLELNPRMPQQSHRSFIRNMDPDFEVTPTRNVIYVAAPPDIHHNASYMEAWTQPASAAAATASWNMSPVPHFVRDVMDYLRAFFTGFTVKLLDLPPPGLCFVNWDNSPRTAEMHASGSRASQSIPGYVGLAIGGGEREIIGIKTRPCPDRVFPVQLNVRGFVDAAIKFLPEDGYCVLFLVNQDLYYKVEETFISGVSFPIERVAVISTARYNPTLDAIHRVQREHAWPASHCRDYVYKCLADYLASYRARMRIYPANLDDEAPGLASHDAHLPQQQPSDELLVSPMYVALMAFTESQPPRYLLVPTHSRPQPGMDLGLWLWRLCTSASRHIGYCFGIHPCVYYACVMQSAARIPQQVLVPPYLCPVDLAKVLRMARHALEFQRVGEIIPEAPAPGPRVHYLALLAFCQQYIGSQMFDAFAGWIRARLAEMEEIEE